VKIAEADRTASVRVVTLHALGETT